MKALEQKTYLSKLLKENKDAIIVGSLGNISKDLEAIGHDNLVTVRGAMGLAIGVGVGIAKNTDQHVIVVIGDGSLLMHMGSISTVLKEDLDNLEVIILDNNCYNSCGGQETNFKYIADMIPFEIVNVK